MKSKEWSGSGLPPIGTVCEYYWSEGYEWRKCEIVAHHNGKVVAVDAGDGSAFILPAASFLKIKTPEQIAAEERNLAIKEMCEVASKRNTKGLTLMESLYDAGYRKTEVKK